VNLILGNHGAALQINSTVYGAAKSRHKSTPFIVRDEMPDIIY